MLRKLLGNLVILNKESSIGKNRSYYYYWKLINSLIENLINCFI